MKTNLKLIVVVAMFLTSSLVYATNPKIKVVSKSSFVLSIKNFKESVSLNIKDKNDVILYSQVVESAEGMYAKKFSLEAWPDGVYEVDVEDYIKVITLTIEVKDNEIVNTSNEYKTMYKPSLIQKGSKVYVSLFPTVKTPFDVVIYNDNDQIVYEGEIVESGKVYEFKKPGAYTVALKNEEGYYSHEVEVTK